VIDFTSKVLTVFKADVSDMKSGLKDLQGEEKKLAQAQLDAANQRNSSMDDWVKRLGNVNQALELVGRAVGFAGDALKAYASELRLEAAAGSANVDKLSDAFGGLFTRHEVLTFAAQTQRGVMKLNQEQMETLAKATVSLTRAGFDQEDVYQKLKDAAIGLKVGGLDDLGIAVEKGSTDAETMSNMMEGLNKVIHENKGLTSTAADDVTRLGVAWANAKDSLMSYAGASMTLGGMKEGRGFGFDAANVLTFGQAGRNLDNRKTREANATGAARDAAMSGIGSSTDEWGNYVGPTDAWATADGDGRLDEASFYTFTNGVLQKIPKVKKKGTGGGGRGKPDTRAKDRTDLLVSQLESEIENADPNSVVDGMGGGYDSLMNTPGMGGIDIEGEYQKLIDAQRRITEQNYEAFRATEQQTFLESTFGKLEDFDAYAAAFQMLSGGVSASMDAWISGSMSAGQAFKKFIGDALKGLASQLAVEALKHGAYALGSLAFGDVSGAGRHAAAAAAFGAGAAAAAIAAKSMGGGGASASAGGGSSSGASGSNARGGGTASTGNGGSGDGGGGRSNTIIVYGDSFSNDSPRMRQVHAEQLVKKAMGSSSATHS
jgi:hypothetical protein